MPYLERDDLWRKAVEAYQKDKWFLNNPPHELALVSIPNLICPSDGRTNRDFYPTMGFTHYLGVSGSNFLKKDGVLFVDSRIRFSDIRDGLSNTVMLGERPPSSDGVWGWWYAGWGQNKDGSAEMMLGVREINSYGQPQCSPCAKGPFHFQRGGYQCDFFHFWSQHNGGANFLFADGSSRFLKYEADTILPALATRYGREIVELPD